jgi:DnaJ-class molecular chaperone
MAGNLPAGVTDATIDELEQPIKTCPVCGGIGTVAPRHTMYCDECSGWGVVNAQAAR